MRLAYITYSIIVVVGSMLISFADDEDSGSWHRSGGHGRVGGGWSGGGWGIGHK